MESKYLMKLSPIVLFVYNRPWHTRQTIEALQKNELADQSDLFIFSDGPKNEQTQEAVQEVRKYIRTFDGFKSVTIQEREKNLGLAKSVISGVTELIAKYGKIIVVEDDLVTSNDFLSFMNQALNWFENESRIFSVSGFNFPIIVPNHYKYDAYCSYRSMSWGWGTWKDRWLKSDWDIGDFKRFLADKNAQYSFNRGGDDLTDMLILQMTSKIDSWSIRWDYTHHKHNAFAILPVESKIYNIGFDTSGVHCKNAPFRQSPLKNNAHKRFIFFRNILKDKFYIDEIKRLHRYSFITRIKKFIKRLLGV